jgi:ketosteroid isomerase-like protein
LRFAAVSVASVVSTACATPGAADEARLPGKELAAAVQAYDQATVRNDTRTLAELVSDDYMLVNSDASVQDKASYLADFAVPGFKIDPYRMEQAFFRIHRDAALTGGTLHLRWTQEGRRNSRRLRAAHLWVRHAGRWRLAYSQLTRVPE